MTYNSMMTTALVFGAFGLIIGSFLNVLILRWGERPLTGRSSCGSCGSTIRWYDLIPVVSWIMLRGRCRSCGAKISLQYVIVEVCTGLIFAGIGFSAIPVIFRVIALPIAALLVAIAVYDFRHTLMPDSWVYTVGGLSLLASVGAALQGTLAESVISVLLAGPAVAFPLFVLWTASRLRGLPAGAWMGFGDVKFALAMGWLLGISSGLQALLLAFVIGALVSVPLLFFSTQVWERIAESVTPTGISSKFRLGFTMKSEIPFGPFLIASTFIVWISNMYGLTIPLFGL